MIHHPKRFLLCIFFSSSSRLAEKRADSLHRVSGTMDVESSVTHNSLEHIWRPTRLGKQLRGRQTRQTPLMRVSLPLILCSSCLKRSVRGLWVQRNMNTAVAIWYFLPFAAHEACSRAPRQTKRPSLPHRAAQTQHGCTRTSNLLPGLHYACIHCYAPGHTASHLIEEVPVTAGQGKQRGGTHYTVIRLLYYWIIQPFRAARSYIDQGCWGN